MHFLWLLPSSLFCCLSGSCLPPPQLSYILAIQQRSLGSSSLLRRTWLQPSCWRGVRGGREKPPESQFARINRARLFRESIAHPQRFVWYHSLTVCCVFWVMKVLQVLCASQILHSSQPDLIFDMRCNELKYMYLETSYTWRIIRGDLTECSCNSECIRA